MRAKLRPIILAAICTALLPLGPRPGAAAEKVRFESARYLPGPLQVRLARERGETLPRPPAEIIDGYLTRPPGDGPFAAIIHLHGCDGLPESVKAGASAGFWPELFASWGYVVLAVDSFTARGVRQACTAPGPGRVGDVHGAVAFLAGLAFVDAKRIAIAGFSAGGLVTLETIDAGNDDLFENQRPFKAAVAFYPVCRSGEITVPTLILIGELDDWTRPAPCRELAARAKETGSPVTLIVHPRAHHGFDIAALQPGREAFGHWVEYNAAATERSVQEVRHFFAQHLAP